MNWNDLTQLSVYLIVLLMTVKPLGIYMACVYEGRPAGLNVWFGPFEKWIYRVSGVKEDAGMTWKEYAVALMLFNVLGLIVVYAIQRLQSFLPLNPMAMPASMGPPNLSS